MRALVYQPGHYGNAFVSHSELAKYVDPSKSTRMHSSIIAEAVKRLRRTAGLTQTELAERAGLARSTIAAIEGAKYASTDIATLQAIANALDVSVEQLYTPLAQRTLIEPHVEAFLRSEWASALRPTAAEIVWLRSLGEVVFFGLPPTEKTIGQLLLWRRNAANQ